MSPFLNAAAASFAAVRMAGPSSSSVRTMRMPRPPPPADALMMTGKPISRARSSASSSARQRVGAAGQDGQAGLLHRAARLDLVAHHADDLGARADELDVARLADFGELRRLGEEAVARMDGINVGDFGGGDDRGDVQVALRRGGGADADGLVGEAHVQRVAVGGRMHRDRLDAHLLARPDDAARDLAAVRDQDFAESSH